MFLKKNDHHWNFEYLTGFKNLLSILVLLLMASPVLAQEPVISLQDFQFLEQMTKDVLESSRIYPDQKLPDPFGKNNTGGILVRPGGRDTYPAFWIRDYAMSLETGMVGKEEQKHILLLTARTQCDQTWINKADDAMIPVGAIADHIRVENSLPIYYPGTYDYVEQGSKQYQFGLFPPYCDQFFFIHIAHYYVKSTSSTKILKEEINGTRLIDRLELAFKVPPTRQGSPLVYTAEAFIGVDFGFRDAIYITGDLCFASILKFRAAKELSELFDLLKNKEKAKAYREIAAQIKNLLPGAFANSDGMLLASTGKSRQADVWSTSLAVFWGILEGDEMTKACNHLKQAYIQKKLSVKGNVRHIIIGEDYSPATAWEAAKVSVNTYQNGAYWGTPTGWVAYAIAKVDMQSARQLIKEYTDDLRENDYRKGEQYQAPYECIDPSGFIRGPVYLTTVSCPYSALKKMLIKN
jgi:hypothetical protein